MRQSYTFDTLARAAFVGFLSGVVGGVWVFVAVLLEAREYASTLPPMSRASFICDAVNMAILLGFFTMTAGALFGGGLGAIFLAYKRAVGRRPLP